MPLQRTETYSNPGASTKASWNCDPSIAPFQVSIVCVVTGSVDYKLQYSYDVDTADASSSWFDSATIPAGTTSTKEQQFTHPIAKIRLVFASGTGSVKMTMLQGMSIN